MATVLDRQVRTGFSNYLATFGLCRGSYCCMADLYVFVEFLQSFIVLVQSIWLQQTFVPLTCHTDVVEPTTKRKRTSMKSLAVFSVHSSDSNRISES